eukprot:c12755_g2_i1 orf=323-1768(-)
MRWFPDLANAAFCETVELRKKILDNQLNRNSSLRQGVEPSSAEFIAALAAGIHSRSILQVGCGISTIALAAAAQATGGFLVSIHTDEAKQGIVRHHMKYLGLLAFVEFIVSSEPNSVILARKNIDFAHFTGDPKAYIQHFDLLNLNNGAIVAADNALSDACHEYIRHVRRQPGTDSSTLPLARGIEVTKVTYWEKFKSGRKVYSGVCEDAIEERDNGIRLLSCADEETTTSTFFPGYEGIKTAISCKENSHEETTISTFSLGDEGSKTANDQTNASSGKEDSSAASSPVMPDKTSTCDISKPTNSKLDSPGLSADELQVSYVDPIVEVVSNNCPSFSKHISSHSKEACVESNTTGNPSLIHDRVNLGSDGILDSCDASSVFKVHFQSHGLDTEVSITGVNQDMLLSDITTAFSDMGISVKTANISTHDNLVDDIFFVTDAKSGAPLHPSQWNCVRDRILQRIGQRYVGGFCTIEGEKSVQV